MIVNWLLEKDTFEENLDPIKKAILDCGHSFKETSYVPFQSGEYKHLFNSKKDCVVTYGSIQLANEIKKCYWTPGVYSSSERYECTYYYPILKDFILNSHYKFIPYGDLKDKENEIFEEFGNSDCVFVRPSSVEKLFTGKVVERKNWSKDIDYFGFYDTPNDAICVVAEPKNVENEWRLVSVDRKIVASSSYRIGRQKVLMEGCPPEVKALGEEITKRFNPDACWTIDICRNEEETKKLIEVLQEAEESFLRNLVKEYLEARKVFSSNTDMLRASVTRYKTPKESAFCSLNYFTKRAALRQACGMVMCEVARKYEECSESALECPSLVNSGKSDEAAARMVSLKESEEALFEKYSN